MTNNQLVELKDMVRYLYVDSLPKGDKAMDTFYSRVQSWAKTAGLMDDEEDVIIIEDLCVVYEDKYIMDTCLQLASTSTSRSDLETKVALFRVAYMGDVFDSIFAVAMAKGLVIMQAAATLDPNPIVSIEVKIPTTPSQSDRPDFECVGENTLLTITETGYHI